VPRRRDHAEDRRRAPPPSGGEAPRPGADQVLLAARAARAAQEALHLRAGRLDQRAPPLGHLPEAARGAHPVRRRALEEGAGRRRARPLRPPGREGPRAPGRPGAALQPVGMFLDLFYGLRDEGVPVAIQEWQAFLSALEQGLHGADLLRFYHLGRACLVKSETYFDAYDRVFARVFKGVEGQLGGAVTDRLRGWLREANDLSERTPEQLPELERLPSDELLRRFLETLGEQTERHDGGNRWIGTGGRSPYGNNGTHPTGIRVGGQSRSRSAMKVAEERRFADYRPDRALDSRQRAA